MAVQVGGLRPGQPACADRGAAPGPSEPVRLDVGPLNPVELVDPEAEADPDPGEPTSWRARIDLTTSEVTTIQAA